MDCAYTTGCDELSNRTTTATIRMESEILIGRSFESGSLDVTLGFAFQYHLLWVRSPTAILRDFRFRLLPTQYLDKDTKLLETCLARNWARCAGRQLDEDERPQKL